MMLQEIDKSIDILPYKQPHPSPHPPPLEFSTLKLAHSEPPKLGTYVCNVPTATGSSSGLVLLVDCDSLYFLVPPIFRVMAAL